MDDEFNEEQSRNVRYLPTVAQFQKTYGMSFETNHKKAVEAFKMYESGEKLRRLQTELLWIKDGRASLKTCDAVIGKKHAARHQSYENWARLMLIWISEARN